MAQSLLKGKIFFCREWAFAKILYCLEQRPTSKTCGALIMGGPGSGKTALCSEVIWPTSNHGKQKSLSRHILAYHFCQAQDMDTFSVVSFIRRLVDQLCSSELICGYKEKISSPDVQKLLNVSELETNPDEAFKSCVLLPLLSINPPRLNLFIIVDSIDEFPPHCFNGSSQTIAQLLAKHNQMFPQWLLLVCSVRKQSRSVTRLFTGFRKITIDDLRKSHVVRDVQQYILSRLDNEETLRQLLSRETAEMLNQLHIKSNGCFLYLERVLDGVVDNFIMLREIRDIPGTLNGLYLWLCQRLFNKEQFLKVQPLLNAILAAQKPLTKRELLLCDQSLDVSLTDAMFEKHLKLLDKLLITGPNETIILFHHSFAEWLLDVKHCTQKFLCMPSAGHGMIAMAYTLHKNELKSAEEVHDFALHLTKSDLQPGQQPWHLALKLVQSQTSTDDDGSPLSSGKQDIARILLMAGSDSNTASGVTSVIKVNEQEDPLLSLLANGGDVNEVDSSGRTLLSTASHQGKTKLVKHLLSKGAHTEIEDSNGQTALNLAAKQGHVHVLLALIEAKCNIDHSDHEGWTPLRSAAWGGHTDVVVALLKAGAQVDLADSDGRTALRAAAWGGHDDIVQSLLENNAQVNNVDNEGRTALIAAAYMGHTEIVECLLDYGADINQKDSDGRTALSVAALCVPASAGHSRVVSLLLDRNAEVDHRDQEGMTPLLVAAYEGHDTVCELLLEGGADVDASDDADRTPLFAAASMGHAKVVSMLLFWGAAIDTIDAEGRTVLSIAALQGSVDVVKLLLDRGLDEMHKDNCGWTPLHMAAFEGHRDVCEALLKVGPRLTPANDVDNDGRHALILAAQEGHVACVLLLLEYGARIDRKTHDGRTALRVAALEGHKEVVHLLICNGADLNYLDADGRSTVYVLALENKLPCCKFLLEQGADPEITDVEERTPLHVSAWQGHFQMVELLLNHGANVNAVDADHRSALHLAAWQGHTIICKLLLDFGTRVDGTCSQGATALCIAAQEGHKDVVKILLESGADPYHVDEFGRNALRVAMKNSHSEVVEILGKHGVDVGIGQPIRHPRSSSSEQMKPSVPSAMASLHSRSTSSSNESASFDKRTSGIYEATTSCTTSSSSHVHEDGSTFAHHFRQNSPPGNKSCNEVKCIEDSALDNPISPASETSWFSAPQEYNKKQPINIITNPLMHDIILSSNNLDIFKNNHPLFEEPESDDCGHKPSFPQMIRERFLLSKVSSRSAKLKRNGISTNPNFAKMAAKRDNCREVSQVSGKYNAHIPKAKSAPVLQPKHSNGLIKKESPI